VVGRALRREVEVGDPVGIEVPRGDCQGVTVDHVHERRGLIARQEPPGPEAGEEERVGLPDREEVVHAVAVDVAGREELVAELGGGRLPRPGAVRGVERGEAGDGAREEHHLSDPACVRRPQGEVGDAVAVPVRPHDRGATIVVGVDPIEPGRHIRRRQPPGLVAGRR
jgi:hypothetical protein